MLLTATDQKTAKKHHIDSRAMWWRIISPFYDFFCGFWSVAVNII